MNIQKRLCRESSRSIPRWAKSWTLRCFRCAASFRANPGRLGQLLSGHPLPDNTVESHRARLDPGTATSLCLPTAHVSPNVLQHAAYHRGRASLAAAAPFTTVSHVRRSHPRAAEPVSRAFVLRNRDIHPYSYAATRPRGFKRGWPLRGPAGLYQRHRPVRASRAPRIYEADSTWTSTPKHEGGGGCIDLCAWSATRGAAPTCLNANCIFPLSLFQPAPSSPLPRTTARRRGSALLPTPLRKDASTRPPSQPLSAPVLLGPAADGHSSASTLAGRGLLAGFNRYTNVKPRVAPTAALL